MTGAVKREIMMKLLQKEVEFLKKLQKGIIPEKTVQQELAEEYGCTPNKIAVIKCYYKKGGINALVDDKPRGGYRKGAGRPTEKTRKWRAARGIVKDKDVRPGFIKTRV